MADGFVDSARQAGLPARAHESSGVDLRFRSITFETAVADAAGDVKRLFTVGAHEIPVRCQIMCDAIAGATDIDLGLYRPGGGVVVDKDALMDGTDIAAGKAYSDQVDGLSALGVEERGVKSFFDIANDVATADVIGHLPNDSYDLALTEVSEVTAAGTITIHLWTIDQQ
jgi:hypothetical protein